ncbi:MAG: FlgD immunoglobulin-like domain containing protein [Bacteroidota bacterium]
MLRAQQPLVNGEMYVYVTNPSGAQVQIAIDAVGVVWGSKVSNYPITHDFDHYETYGSGFQADHVDNPNYPNPNFGYGKYRITITKGSNNYTAYADYRDCDYQSHNEYFTNPDITIEFDYNNSRFNGDSDVQIWDEDHKNQQYPQAMACFKIPATVQNSFSGGEIGVDDTTRSSPYSSQWSLNSEHTVSAISPQTYSNGQWVWCVWSDGDVQSHFVTADGSSDDIVQTASFLGAYISGPSFLEKGQSATYNSNPTGGSGNRSYQWYKHYEGNPNWYTLGTSSTQQVTMITNSFTLKVEVVDNTYGKTATATKYVEYDDGGNSPSTGDLSNSPNPFNPTTEMQFGVPRDSKVQIIIYDILGRKVRTLVDNPMAPGTYKATWDGRDDNGLGVASGVYLYRIVAKNSSGSGQDFVLTKKMILMK